MVNVRRLAAVDLSGLGPGIVIPEFALAVVGAPALGILTVLRSGSFATTTFGVALIGLGVNYVPLLVHAIDLVRHSAVDVTIADHGLDRRALYAKYRRQSLWLLLPFVVAIAGLAQMKRR
jgi:hypothetical protein